MILYCNRKYNRRSKRYHKTHTSKEQTEKHYMHEKLKWGETEESLQCVGNGKLRVKARHSVCCFFLIFSSRPHCSTPHASPSSSPPYSPSNKLEFPTLTLRKQKMQTKDTMFLENSFPLAKTTREKQREK